MMMCKRLAQVPMLCVPIYNIKLAMMQRTPIFTTFSAHTKMAADKRGQIEVFARNLSIRWASDELSLQDAASRQLAEIWVMSSRRFQEAKFGRCVRNHEMYFAAERQGVPEWELRHPSTSNHYQIIITVCMSLYVLEFLDGHVCEGMRIAHASMFALATAAETLKNAIFETHTV